MEYFVGDAVQRQKCDVTVDGQQVMLNVEYQKWSYKFQTVYEPEQTYSIEFTMPITNTVSVWNRSVKREATIQTLPVKTLIGLHLD